MSVGVLVAAMWLVQLANWLCGYALNQFGILPRTLSGLPGVLTSPFLHGSFGHTVANTVPLLVLGLLVAMQGSRAFAGRVTAIVVITGVCVWLFGRTSYHVGASGLVFGLFGYLLGRMWYLRSLASLAAAAVAVALYGGLVWGLVPARSISVESHLFGLLAGILLARIESSRRGN
jgi:membrane associated rhomboid family serine protease